MTRKPVSLQKVLAMAWHWPRPHEAKMYFALSFTIAAIGTNTCGFGSGPQFLRVLTNMHPALA